MTQKPVAKTTTPASKATPVETQEQPKVVAPAETPVAAPVEAKPAASKKAAPAKKPVTKPAAKPATKPVVDVPAPAAAPAEKVKKTTKAEAKAVSKAETKTEPKATKASAKKVKQVRDSFTFPETEYAQFSALKQRALAAGMDVKKSELLRAGLALLVGLDDAGFKAAITQVERIKTGRPSKK